MRLTGGKQKLDYLLASIADYSAPLVFFITLFYCTNLICVDVYNTYIVLRGWILAVFFHHSVRISVWMLYYS